MKIDKVKNLSPLARFRYWVKERHSIHLKKQDGKPKPWTDDIILQSSFFTNPYREHDKTTVWFKNNVRDPLKNIERVVFATICFRWFNLISTGEILLKEGLLEDWDLAGARKILSKGNKKIFTGAFMIQSPGGKTKLESISQRIENVWQDRHELERRAMSWKSLKQAHTDLLGYDGLGGFMAYEIVTDLRHTAFLRNATDIMTWCNPGPGCIRGLYWSKGEPPPGKNNSSSPPRPKDWEDTMELILDWANEWLPKEGMYPFEMREVEHSLCEYDKYSRLLFETGRAKRVYHGLS